MELAPSKQRLSSKTKQQHAKSYCIMRSCKLMKYDLPLAVTNSNYDEQHETAKHCQSRGLSMNCKEAQTQQEEVEVAPIDKCCAPRPSHTSVKTSTVEVARRIEASLKPDDSHAKRQQKQQQQQQHRQQYPQQNHISRANAAAAGMTMNMTNKTRKSNAQRDDCQLAKRSQLDASPINSTNINLITFGGPVCGKRRHQTINAKSPPSDGTWASFVYLIMIWLSLATDLHQHQQHYFARYHHQASTETAPTTLTRSLWRSPVMLLAAGQQYKPEWPVKSVEQEIFLLNLEDGYFGCQVNSSQDFLQLFELSRLCDGQAQCYLGTDELESPLKCNNRTSCGARINGRGQFESVSCANGVCLDGLCYCNDGFGGKSCDIPDENECKFRPCDVFAHCTNTMGSYYCSCFPGYDGDGIHCQDINECEIPSLRALCADNSECVNLPGHFVCKCKPGYQQSDQSQSSLSGAPIGNTTVQCTDIDECLDERSCGKGATCENLPGSFRCSCPPGFAGDPTVECTDMDECRNSPCGIGAQCTNLPGGYRCSCAPGFERNPAAPSTMFGTILTSHQSTLATEQQQQQQQLINSPAWPTTGVNGSQLIACLDVNECNKVVCGTGAHCVNTPGAYFCQCPAGFEGNPKVSCSDIDECASVSPACGSNTICINTPGQFKCQCKPGYSGNAYSPEGCQDDDECSRKDACGLNAQCFNTPGSFQCTCSTGFAGDPYARCQDVNECAGPGPSPCGPGAQCHNTDGGFRCACPDKYLARGTPDLGCERAAVDIGCSGDFECTQNAQCVNATCQCKLGYKISGIDCVDVDECAVSVHQQQQATNNNNLPTSSQAPIKAFTRLSAASLSLHNNNNNNNQLGNGSISALCGPEATCHNTDGSYWCECKPGYEKLLDQTSDGNNNNNRLQTTGKCRDINECEQSSPVCGQNSKCFNTDGGFKCACDDGFIAIDQNMSNGCKSPCDGIDCGQHATCKPHGQEAACVCKPGFTFDPNNIKLGCVDINECDSNYGPSGLCGQRAQCVNEPGSYRCQCPPGYQGDAYRFCEDVNECDRKFGIFGQCGELAVCTNKPGTFSCACAPGYQGDPRQKCTDVDECAMDKFGPSGKCGLNAQCTNLPGRFSCSCPAGFTGDPTIKCEPERPSCSTSSDCATNQVCQSGQCHCPFATSGGVDSNSDSTGGKLATCKHPCDKTECGPNATCQLDGDNQPLCVCDSGYMAPGDGRSGCVDVNECIQGLTLSGATPISALTSGAGSVAVGPAPTNGGGLAVNGTLGGHPCGRNALCRNQPGSFDCVCPPGYSGNAYEACQMDVKNQNQNQQQQPTTTTSSEQKSTTTATTTTLTSANNNSNMSANAFGQYQQEPRTSTCQEACSRGQVCLDGQCVRPDACRDNNDCKLQQSCEHVNQLLGFQCVNVCDLNQCGPDAKCQLGQAHKPICTCDTQAGYAGDPYDLIAGCSRLVSPTPPTGAQDSQGQTTRFTVTSTTSGAGQRTATATTTTTPDNQYQQQRQGGDISTVSLSDDFQSTTTTTTNNQRLQTLGGQHHTMGGDSGTGTTSSMDQLHRQQVLEQQQQLKNKHNNSAIGQHQQPPLVAYDLPLPTTPIMPQFETTFGTTSGSKYGNNYLQNVSTQTVPNTYTDANGGYQQQTMKTTSPGQIAITSTGSRQQQQQQTTLMPPQQNLFTTKRVQQQQQQQQHQTNDMIPVQGQDNDSQLGQKQANGAAIGQLQQSTSMTKSSSGQQQEERTHHEQHVAQQQLQQQQQQQHYDNQLMVSNKTTSTTSGQHLSAQQHRQVACTSDQHCPGNLFCLMRHQIDHQMAYFGLQLQHQQRVCGCPAGYRREADYCYLQRVNCTSSSMCKPREECIGSSQLVQYYSTSTTTTTIGQQQATSISQQFSLGTNSDNSDLAPQYANQAPGGLCICPRGYKLINSGIACIDRNECDEGTPCAVGAICQNRIGTYECVCPPGTIGEPYTKTCEPLIKGVVDVTQQQVNEQQQQFNYECQSNSDCPNDRECDLTLRKCVSPCHICGPRAVCTATNHAAICLCPPKFTGNAIDLVYGCQEAFVPTTTTPLTTTTIATTTPPQTTTTSRPPQTTTAIGTPVTTLLPSITTTTTPSSSSTTDRPTTTTATGLAESTTTTPESVEFRTIPPSELFVMCLADGIQVEVQLGGFDGIIYVKGHSQDPKCRKLVQSSASPSEFVDFKVQFGHCDLIHRDGEAGFVLVIQKHPKLVTYRARAYHVKCVYNTGERTVSLGFNVSMITTSGTIANTGPPPTCLMSITALDGREVTSAEIGQDLLLRVDVQPDTIYGGFARSCEAKTMDDEGEYQYEVTDANGCATDPTIFSDWKYDQSRKSLVARFNAFKFPSSNNLRFQCNIRVCFGACPAVNCNGIDAYGKRRRRRRDTQTDEAFMLAGSNSSSLALANYTNNYNYDDNTNNNNNNDDDANANANESGTSQGEDELIVGDTYKKGALREEIMVQSNAILTFDKKEASLPQQRPPVEDIEFVCLPRLGIVMSIGVTVLLALAALAMATSCLAANKRRRANYMQRHANHNGPLPHPVHFPNPLMQRSSSVSTLQESLYGT